MTRRPGKESLSVAEAARYLAAKCATDENTARAALEVAFSNFELTPVLRDNHGDRCLWAYVDWSKAIIYWYGSKSLLADRRGPGWTRRFEVSRNEIDQWIRRTALQRARVPTAPELWGGTLVSKRPSDLIARPTETSADLTKGIEDGTGLSAYLTFWELSLWYTYGVVGSYPAAARWRASISDRWRRDASPSRCPTKLWASRRQLSTLLSFSRISIGNPRT